MTNLNKTQHQQTNSGHFVILEEKILFSKSMLWELQKEAYSQFGTTAWTEKGVPFYLTSNPHTVRIYVNMFLSYIQDILNDKTKIHLDTSAPIYIFDLGAGSGRFAFLFLKQLLSDLADLNLQSLKFCYVITDIVQKNIDFCAAHPQMQDFIQKGILDFALYNHSQTKPLELLHHKVVLESPLKNPAALIANYFFDTIPQDLYKVSGGALMTGKITLSVPKEAIKNKRTEMDPAWINHLSARYDYSPYQPTETYSNNNIEAILKEYCLKFEEIPFLFPTGACQAIEYFRKLTKDSFLLLAGDQGVCTEEQIRAWGEPHIARHGSFSIAVSYHALKLYFENAGGGGLLTKEPDPLFVIIAAMLGGKIQDFPHIKCAFKNNMEAFEPSDYWKIVGAVEQECSSPSLKHILALLKLGNWDPINFNTFFESIRSKISSSSQQEQRQLCQAIENVWENFYWVSEDEGGFIMNLGVLYFEMKRFKEALTFFERAETLMGSTPALKQNIAICRRLAN